MSSEYGTKINISIFGESHGPAIGVTIQGLPAGEPIDLEALQLQMSRRAPGQDKTATTRSEADIPEFLSGLLEGKTTGAPLCAVIRNTNTRSGDYSNVALCPRPNHSDYAAYVRYGGNNDIRGGGHFSARLTAPLLVAGAIAKQILARRGVEIGGHVVQIGTALDTPFDPVTVSAEQLRALSSRYFAVIDPAAQEEMRAQVEAARLDCDSLGGRVEIAAVGLPAGLGDPMFAGVENRLAAAIYGVPAVKAVSFGIGAEFASLRGSQANDPLAIREGKVVTLTNHCGGICGGITNGMPLLVQAVFKPTPSIGKPQQTVNLETMEETTLQIKGRHDPCIVPRGLPAVEAAVAVALLNLMAEGGAL